MVLNRLTPIFFERDRDLTPVEPYLELMIVQVEIARIFAMLHLMQKRHHLS